MQISYVVRFSLPEVLQLQKLHVRQYLRYGPVAMLMENFMADR